MIREKEGNFRTCVNAQVSYFNRMVHRGVEKGGRMHRGVREKGGNVPRRGE